MYTFLDIYLVPGNIYSSTVISFLCPTYCVPSCHPHEQQRPPRAATALEEVREEERAPAPPFQPFLQQNPAPQSFGSSMVQSMTWGA